MADPLLDEETLNKFVIDVERLEKYTEGLTRRSLNGPTALDIKWKVRVLLSLKAFLSSFNVLKAPIGSLLYLLYIFCRKCKISRTPTRKSTPYLWLGVVPQRIGFLKSCRVSSKCILQTVYCCYTVTVAHYLYFYICYDCF